MTVPTPPPRRPVTAETVRQKLARNSLSGLAERLPDKDEEYDHLTGYGYVHGDRKLDYDFPSIGTVAEVDREAEEEDPAKWSLRRLHIAPGPWGHAVSRKLAFFAIALHVGDPGAWVPRRGAYLRSSDQPPDPIATGPIPVQELLWEARLPQGSALWRSEGRLRTSIVGTLVRLTDESAEAAGGQKRTRTEAGLP